VCFLHDGQIHERGTPAALLDAPATPELQRFLRRFHAIA
jgi:polar amino acid transport system ATP-binding protein